AICAFPAILELRTCDPDRLNRRRHRRRTRPGALDGASLRFPAIELDLARAFNLHAQPAGKAARSRFRILHHLNGMHRLRLHPESTPFAQMHRLLLARLIMPVAVRCVRGDGRRLAARVVANEETRPAMEVHRLGMSRRRSVTWRTRMNSFSKITLWLPGAACTASKPS